MLFGKGSFLKLQKLKNNILMIKKNTFTLKFFILFFQFEELFVSDKSLSSTPFQNPGPAGALVFETFLKLGKLQRKSYFNKN